MNFIDSEVNETFNRILASVNKFASTIELTKTLFNTSQNKSGLLKNFCSQLSIFISQISTEQENLEELKPLKKNDKNISDFYTSICKNSSVKNVDLDHTVNSKSDKKDSIYESLERMNLKDVINIQRNRTRFPSLNLSCLEDLISTSEESDSEPKLHNQMDTVSDHDSFIKSKILKAVKSEHVKPPVSEIDDLVSNADSNPTSKPSGRDCLQNLLNNLESENLFKKFEKKIFISDSSSDSDNDKENQPRGRKPKSVNNPESDSNKSQKNNQSISEDGSYLEMKEESTNKNDSTSQDVPILDNPNLSSEEMDSTTGSSSVKSNGKKRGRPSKKNRESINKQQESQYTGFNLNILKDQEGKPESDKNSSQKQEIESSRKSSLRQNTQRHKITEESDLSFKPLQTDKPIEKSNNKTEKIKQDECVIIGSSSASSEVESDEVSPKKPEKNIKVETDPSTKGDSKSTEIKQDKEEIQLSDEEDAIKGPKKTTFNAKMSQKNTSDDTSNTKNKKKPDNSTKRKRKRVQVNDSGDSDAENDSDYVNEEDDDDVKIIEDEDDDEELGSDDRGRKKIRKIMSENKISNLTRQAESEELLRRKRIEERQKLYNKFEEKVAELNDGKAIVLERDCKTKEVLVKVHEEISCKLKRHQIDAIRFLYDCVVESIEQYKKGHSEGAVLAHCMGLGKTLTTISFVHTLLEHEKFFNIKTCLVLCPVNTVLNWTNEFNLWVPENASVYTYELVNQSNQVKERINIISNWKKNGGVLVMGYEMYRNLLTVSIKRIKSKESKERLLQGLVDPGPDIVVCDEGHLLKNDKSHLSKAVNKIKTRKRIVLTGTPLQNNLVEYWTMINFVKPNLLGTLKEFSNRFANPIKNGQHSNSTDHDVKLMKKRAHILYKTLDGCVQRRDYQCLTSILPPRYEYIIKCRLHDLQSKIYEKYLELRPSCTGLRATLFIDYQNLYRVYSHPYCLKMNKLKMARKTILDDGDEPFDEQDDYESEEEEETGSEEEDDEKASLKRSTKNDSVEEISSGDSSDSLENIPKKKTRKVLSKEEVSKLDRQQKESWWEEFYQPEYDYDIELGGKLEALFLILKECSDIGDKVVIFSHSLYSLDLIEHFLYQIDNQWRYDNKMSRDECADYAPSVIHTMDEVIAKPRPDDKLNYKKYYSDTEHNTWIRGQDYERIDGSVNAQTRKEYQVRFNRQSDHRFRLFLISTRAGGLGINLTGANRMIIFDVSWNPSHDIQSIFRCYRFGQTKPVYIYRLIAQGTMEEKIYDRQVTKQSLALRVIDEKQIDRHFSENDLQELYTFEPDIFDPKKPTQLPNLPKDRLLAEILRSSNHLIADYHNHDSLLENREDEGLTEDERKEAWREYEAERKAGVNVVQQNKHNYVVGDVQTVLPQNRQLSINELQARQKQLVSLISQRNNITELLKITTANLQQQQTPTDGQQMNANPANMIQTAFLANNLNTLNTRINDLQTEIITRIPKVIPKGVPTNKFYTPVGPSTPQIVINSQPNSNNAQRQTILPNILPNTTNAPAINSTANSATVRYRTIFDQIRISRPELTMAQVDNLTMKTMMDEARTTTIPKNPLNPPTSSTSSSNSGQTSLNRNNMTK